MSSRYDKKKESKISKNHERSYHPNQKSRRDVEVEYSETAPNSSASKSKDIAYDEGSEVVTALSSLAMETQQTPATAYSHNSNAKCEIPCYLGIVVPYPPPRPRPVEPQSHSSREHKNYRENLESWEAEYLTWKNFSCICKNGYFCKAHGQWVSGEAVRNGEASPQSSETSGTCHKYGYFCEKHNEWVSEEEVKRDQAPTRKKQTPQTCHKNGYFCKAHKKWVSGVLIQDGWVPRESKQDEIPEACHPKDGPNPQASRLVPNNGCHSGNGKRGNEGHSIAAPNMLYTSNQAPTSYSRMGGYPLQNSSPGIQTEWESASQPTSTYYPAATSLSQPTVIPSQSNYFPASSLSQVASSFTTTPNNPSQSYYTASSNYVNAPSYDTREMEDFPTVPSTSRAAPVYSSGASSVQQWQYSTSTSEGRTSLANLSSYAHPSTYANSSSYQTSGQYYPQNTNTISTNYAQPSAVGFTEPARPEEVYDEDAPTAPDSPRESHRHSRSSAKGKGKGKGRH